MTNELFRIPVIKLWNNLVVPLQGEVSDELARRLADEVLTRIHDSGALGLVLDLTGVWLLDSHLCAVLSRVAEAASLIGARTIVSGLTPEAALTLQTMGAELRGATTALTLEEALGTLGVYARAPSLVPTVAPSLGSAPSGLPLGSSGTQAGPNNRRR